MAAFKKDRPPVFAKLSTALLICCLGHLAVDGACALSVLSLYRLTHLDWEAIYRLIILYNLIAFGLQPLFGWVLDAYGAHRTGAAGGLLITAGGAALASAQPLTAVIVLGVGNAFFHTGAGAQVFSASGGRASASGMFIAPGAIGLLAGGLLAAKGPVYPIYALPVLLISAALVLMCPPVARPDVGENRSGGYRVDWRLAALLLLMLVVFSRSAIGYALPVPWKGMPKAVIFFVAAAFAGKCLGGVFADRLGWLPATLAMLLAAGGMAAFQAGSFAAACIAMFFVQATTGVTLAATQSLFPRRPAFAFGLPCVAILIGAYPFLLRYPIVIPPGWLVVALSLIAALAVWGIKPLYKRKDISVSS